MRKSLYLAAAAALSLVAQTRAESYGNDFACHYCQLSPYSPVRVQIEGGRTITQGWGAPYLDNGMNVGLGLTWQPSGKVPLALRVDGVYQRFGAREALLAQAASYFSASVDEGTINMWGGDVKNAGLGLRFANGGWAFFFIEARYMRFNANGQKLDLVPIRLGLRF